MPLALRKPKIHCKNKQESEPCLKSQVKMTELPDVGLKPISGSLKKEFNELTEETIAKPTFQC